MPRATPKLKRLIESTGHFVMLVTHRRQQDAYGAKFLDSTEGASLERAFDRFAALEGSAGLLRTLPDPVVLLTDRAPPAGAPADSLGQAHRRFMAANGLTVDYLVGLNKDFTEHRGEDARRKWFRRRTVTSHDLRHVLNGYDTTDPGEFCNLCFRFAQTRHWGVGVLCLLGASVMLGRGDFRGVRAGVEAFLRGRGSMSLDLFPWELHLDVPLAECRAIVGLRPPRYFKGHVEPAAYVGGPPVAGRETVASPA